MTEIPDKYDPHAAEEKWGRAWQDSQIFRWDPDRPRDETFVIDTPPLTVSGSLHIGHVFSYTHQDLIARYQRMCGKTLAYPMGFDDNGLPTERRVQNVFGVRPNPALAYDADWKPRRDKGKKEAVEEISRENFIEACALITDEDEETYEAIWRGLGLSVDWEHRYGTINRHCRRISQYSFLDLLERGQVYSKYSPTMWDIDFRTAVAQAEMEDRERPGAYYDIRFEVEGGGHLVIATTRPELLGACIAVVAHPSDERYTKHFGKTAITPLYGAPVPILPAEHADPEKGTGILMVCTFGDVADVEFWRTSELPLRQLIGRDGRVCEVDYAEAPFVSRDPAAANRDHAEIAGKNVNQARKRIAELLGERGALEGEPRAIQHPVKFYENGDRPLEFVSTRQWFIKLLEHRDALIEQGRKIVWHPEFMRTRYENWVTGLNQDWCVSRQRYFGVPFPVWYPVHASGEIDYDHPIAPSKDALPVDPLAETPPGYTADQRDQPGGFSGDPDVMDTWATSSLTPQIMTRWPDDMARHAKLFPMDLRPSSHEIIRTWAFYTIVKAWMHEGEIPWRNVVISGWILDPDRKKMSKSKGNVVTPAGSLERFGADAVRYWTGRARLGADTAFDEGVLKIGKRLTTKLFNASRFVLSQVDRIGASPDSHGPEAITEPIDVDYVDRLRRTIRRATEGFDRYEYAIALQAAEEAFWDFCDNYLEIVKARSYDDADTPGRRSAIATLLYGLRTYVRLLAPFIPFVTEEVWSWRFASGDGRNRFAATAAWPTTAETSALAGAEGNPYAAAVELAQQLRSAKTRAQKSLRWPVTRLEITAPTADLEIARAVIADVVASGSVESEPVFTEGPAPDGARFAVAVELAAKKA